MHALRKQPSSSLVSPILKLILSSSQPLLATMEALTSLWSTVQAYQGPLVTLLFLFGPSLLARVRALLSPAPPDVSSPPTSRALYAILLLQAAYTAHTLLYPPYDAFASRPLLTPTDALRPLVLSEHGLDGWTSDPLVDLLLARLATVDGRIAYSRWGHAVFFNCAWCRAKEDYALAAIPRVLGPYVAQALVLGMMGWTAVGGAGARARAKRWRTSMGVAVAALAIAEFGTRWWFDLRVVQHHLVHVS